MSVILSIHIYFSKCPLRQLTSFFGRAAGSFDDNLFKSLECSFVCIQVVLPLGGKLSRMILSRSFPLVLSLSALSLGYTVCDAQWPAGQACNLGFTGQDSGRGRRRTLRAVGLNERVGAGGQRLSGVLGTQGKGRPGISGTCIRVTC